MQGGRRSFLLSLLNSFCLVFRSFPPPFLNSYLLRCNSRTTRAPFPKIQLDISTRRRGWATTPRSDPGPPLLPPLGVPSSGPSVSALPHGPSGALFSVPRREPGASGTAARGGAGPAGLRRRRPLLPDPGPRTQPSCRSPVRAGAAGPRSLPRARLRRASEHAGAARPGGVAAAASGGPTPGPAPVPAPGRAAGGRLAHEPGRVFWGGSPGPASPRRPRTGEGAASGGTTPRGRLGRPPRTRPGEPSGQRRQGETRPPGGPARGAATLPGRRRKAERAPAVGPGPAHEHTVPLRPCRARPPPFFWRVVRPAPLPFPRARAFGRERACVTAQVSALTARPRLGVQAGHCSPRWGVT